MLKVFRHHHNNIEEVRPVNGVYKVCELDAYELKYISDSPIIDQKVFLEDILLDCSMFNITQLEVITIKPECLFIDCFGFSSLKVNNEVFNFNVLIEKLKKDDAEGMLMYLWKKDRRLYDIFLSKSSITASNVQETEINITSKFINYANSFYDKMLEYSASFKSLPYYVLRPRSELSNYSANLIDADSIPWILENLDAVSFSPEFRYDPDAIDFNGTYGVIDQVFVNKQVYCYNTYENNIILGGFLRLINKLSSLKKEISNNIDVTKKYSDDNYVDFRDLKKIPYIRLLKEAVDIKRKLENLYLKYRNIFIDALPQIERPTLTPVFIGRRHYANAFKLVQKAWNVKFDFQGDMLLFNIQKMSYLYEMYNFYFLLEVVDKEVKELEFKENESYNDCNAEYFKSYKKDELTINFYYEPHFFCEKQSMLDLVRIDSEEGTYYKPDFLIEFVSLSKGNIYCILDAKYSRERTIGRRLNDCIYKYILNTGIFQNPYRKIDYLFILAPVDKKVDYIMIDSYYPQIGVIPSKPSNVVDMQDTISKIIKKSYEQLSNKYIA
ncbi:hypothetical protein [Coprobacter fastidiosus]|uniref:hypothetical protein n=1 Tax=Coprobacter fastidiosus TaxID=1099853 RepID=UPI00189E7343|nr:hypothetical protein [Coprobacter fastidiosus]